MIIKSILNIINKYNEDGIFVWRKESIYWFNGNRFEYWCKCPCTPFGFHFVYKNKIFKAGILNVFEDRVLYGNLVCRRVHAHAPIELFDGVNIIKIKQPKSPYLYCVFSLENELYIFGFRTYQKFNGQEWIDLACPGEEFYFWNIYLFKGKFYQIVNKSLYWVYDPLGNVWESKFLI